MIFMFIFIIHSLNYSGTSWFASVFLVVNAALGAGLLNFPDAYQQAGGVLIAVLIQAVCVLILINMYTPS